MFQLSVLAATLVSVPTKVGKKGLLVNRRNPCQAPSRANVRMLGQNGKTHSERPVVKNDCTEAQLRKAKRKARLRPTKQGEK